MDCPDLNITASKSEALCEQKDPAESANSQLETTETCNQKHNKNENGYQATQEITETVAPGSSREQPNLEGRSAGFALAAGDQYFRNTILDEVLSEKKMALLHSPEVLKFLQKKLKNPIS